MDNTLSIRHATTADLPALLALYEHLTAGEPPPGLNDAADILHKFERFEGSQILIATIEAKLVASCTLLVIPNLTRTGTPYALLENVVTHGGFRKRGYGHAILKAAIAAAWKAGCYKVMLLAGSLSPDILRFYEGAGFCQSKTGFQIRRMPARPEQDL